MTILSAMFVIVRDENGGCQPVLRRGCELNSSMEDGSVDYETGSLRVASFGHSHPPTLPHFFHPPNPPIAWQSITLDAAPTKRPQRGPTPGGVRGRAINWTTGPASVAIRSRLDSPFYPLI